VFTSPWQYASSFDTPNPNTNPAGQGLNAERRLRGRPDVHLLAYPNSGEGWDARARAWRDGTGLAPDAFGAAAAGWADAGATVIGGARPSSSCDYMTLVQCASCRSVSSYRVSRVRHGRVLSDGARAHQGGVGGAGRGAACGLPVQRIAQ